MKKRYLLFLASFPILAGLVFFFFHPRVATSFELSKEADFYLVTTKGIYTFQQADEKLTLLKEQRATIAEYVHSGFPRARLDDRYLVFSKGWDYPHSYPIATVSMDFQTGTIHTQKTEYFATMGAGQSKRYFYTWKNDGETRLTQFDKEGKELQTKVYDGLLIAGGSFISDRDGTLQLEAVRDTGDGQFYTQLLTIDEATLNLLSEESLYNPPNQHYRLTDSLVADQILYSPVNSIRDMISKEVAPSNQVLITQLDTMEQSFLTLPEYSPRRLYKEGDYLFIEHDATSTYKIGFSIVNRKTEEAHFINLSELLTAELDINTDSIDFFSLLEDNKLVFTVGKYLVYFDLENHQILDTFQLDEEEEQIYTWKPKR